MSLKTAIGGGVVHFIKEVVFVIDIISVVVVVVVVLVVVIVVVVVCWFENLLISHNSGLLASMGVSCRKAILQCLVQIKYNTLHIVEADVVCNLHMPILVDDCR
jgi:hypothetical protein